MEYRSKWIQDWINAPTNILINNISFNNKEFYNTKDILTNIDVYKELKYYIKYSLDTYLYNKENEIIQKDIIDFEEYNSLSKTNKELYTVNEINRYQDGYDSVRTDIINYIKVTAKVINDNILQNKISNFINAERQKIISKILIYHYEYLQLDSLQQKLYAGIKATQTDFTIYREGHNYYELYGKNIITDLEYNSLQYDHKQYYVPDKTSVYFTFIIIKNYTKYILNQ